MNRRLTVLLAVATLSLLMLVSLVMMSSAMQNSERFGRFYSSLLIVNALGLTTFMVLIGLNIRRLVRALRARRLGSRLTLRMLILFTALSVTPVLVVYGFSLDFLHRGIDSWFDLRIEEALEDSLKLSRHALNQRRRELLRQTEQLAHELAEGSIGFTSLGLEPLKDPASSVVSSATLPVNLNELRNRSGADELSLLTRQGGIIAFSSLHDIVPNLPSKTIVLQVQQGQSYAGLDPIGETALAVRIVVKVPDVGADNRLLQALYSLAPGISRLAAQVQSAYSKYKELTYLREQLKISFTMTLTLVLLFTLASAIWAAFYSANRLVAPIQDLAEGTKAVAQGDYSRELPVLSQDEIGFLVSSFNEMTRKIAIARDEAKQSRDQVEAQRAYLEAVLGRLSSGVLTLDQDRYLCTANASASKILGVDLTLLIGESIATICARHPYLQAFQDILGEDLISAPADWRKQVVLFGGSGRQVLMCRGTALSGAVPGQSGHIIVFDDITALLQGQRDAAWSEVARRLAHEIKNPLTPIQLSAERLRHKYLAALPPKDAEVLDRLTHTIIQHVETLKGMVNTFSEYARSPQMHPKPLNLNQLVEEVVDLYRSIDRQAVIAIELEPALPLIEGDVGRLRQVLNNLIKNALEATEETAPPSIEISTCWVEEASHGFIELRIEDRGAGIPQALLNQLFEPYVTNKPKGTGLGLAIVKKIVEEHGGVVWLENNVKRPGACAVIRLPVAAYQVTACALPAQASRNAL